MENQAPGQQTKFAYINKNLSHIKEEVLLGIIPCTLIRHVEIYSRYDHYRKRGYNVRDSALYAGLDYQIKERMVFRIINFMETEV